MEFTYEIDGKTYVQKPLVLGQLRQLLSVLKNVVIPEDANTITLIDVFGGHISEALAVVLTEKGSSLKDKDIASTADTLAFAVTSETAIKVIEDFFTCNPIASLLDRLSGIMGERIRNLPSTGSGRLSSPSAEETSQNETMSSGDTD